MGDTAQDHAADLAALERFVVDNDALLDLEARIGRFNIFDALGIVNNEIRHSNFLAWLLDPNESHGLGGLFLNAVLMDLLRQTPVRDRLFSPIKLDGGELRGVQVRREWNRIDLLITCDDPDFVIAIENKVYSSEHSDQLARYKKIVNETPDLAKHKHRQFVYLTREGNEPSEDDWTIYSYADLHRVLTKVRAAAGDQMGDDVRAFLDHYLRMIGSRFMDDEKIDELCQTIYKNHRQAIELIVERIGNVQSGILSAIEQAIQQDTRWKVVYRGPTYLEVIPVEWINMLPKLGKRTIVPPEHWMTIWFRIGKKQCFNTVQLGPTSDRDLRRKIIERLVADPKEFGLKSLFKDVERIGDSWAALGRLNVDRWDSDKGPDESKVLPKVKAVLDKRAEQLRAVPDALRPIIEQWQREQTAR